MTMQEGTTYEEQTESGKGIVKEILARLAKELNNEQMNSFVFKTTHQDFDQDQVSILDPERDRVVAKVEECDLADAPTTPSIRRKLETQLNSAVRAYFKVQ